MATSPANKRIQIRVTDKEKTLLEQRAQAMHLSLSAYVRLQCLNELEKPGQVLKG